MSSPLSDELSSVKKSINRKLRKVMAELEIIKDLICSNAEHTYAARHPKRPKKKRHGKPKLLRLSMSVKSNDMECVVCGEMGVL